MPLSLILFKVRLFIVKDYISESMKKDFPCNGLSAAQFMIAACSKQEMIENLSEQEKNHLKKITLKLNETKAKLSQKELDDLKEKEILVNENWEWLKKEKKIIEPKDISQLTKQEVENLDSELRLIYKNMREALKDGNIESALTYFDHRSKTRYKKMFSALSLVTLKELSSENQELCFEKIWGRYQVRYEIIVVRDGKKFSFPLTFSQDQGKWKILEY